MTYDLIYRNSDKRILKAATSGSDLTAVAGQTKVSSIDGDIPSSIIPYSEFNTTSGLPEAKSKWHHLYVTASSSSIPGDGVSSTTVTIQKRNYNDENQTGAGDNESVTITTTRGRLSATSGNLTNGQLQVTFTSISETGTITITATENSGMLDSGSANIELTAVAVVGRYREIHLMVGADAAGYRSPAASILSRSGTTNANTVISAAAFDDTTEEFLVWTFRLPTDCEPSGTVSIKIPWIPATAAANNVVWKIYYGGVANAESFDVALSSQSITSSGSATANVITIATISDTLANLGWSAGDILILHLSRDVGSVNDTLVGDAHLMDITVRVPVTATF